MMLLKIEQDSKIQSFHSIWKVVSKYKITGKPYHDENQKKENSDWGEQQFNSESSARYNYIVTKWRRIILLQRGNGPEGSLDLDFDSDFNLINAILLIW